MTGGDYNLEQTVAAAPPVAAPVFRFDGSRLEGIDPAHIATCVFCGPGVLGQAEHRELANAHEQLARHLTARLSTFFRMECEVTVGEISSVRFAEFAGSLAEGSHVTLFSAEPLRGAGVIELSSVLALAMAERLLGGKGGKPAQDRPLTEIELALMEDVIQLVLDEWSRLWQPEAAQPPRVIGHDTTGRFLQTSTPETMTAIVRFECNFGGANGGVAVGVPYAMIEPAVKRLCESRHKSGPPPKPPRWRQPYDAISVPVVAEWPVREITLREALALRPGDVVELSADLIQSTRVRFAEKPEFAGTAGVDNGRVAVQLTRRISGEP